MNILDTRTVKVVASKYYNYIFDKTTGSFTRWGKNQEDDPFYSPYGPEIADIEVSTSCQGPGGKLCKFCYKSNSPKGKNMSLETFKKVLDNIPNTLTQVAFGADAQATSNPELYAMMKYCRSKGIVPNITVADISDATADWLSKMCGAVAVSRYENSNICYDSVKKLTDRGMKQVNIHQMISDETFDQAIETIYGIKNDTRLKDVNAIVFLSLKKKGRGDKYTTLTQDQFNILVSFAFSEGINFGFDSCSAPKFAKAIKGLYNEKELLVMSEPCESTLFSLYVNVDGMYFPCSFTESITEGIDMTREDLDFTTDVWNAKSTTNFRTALKSSCRNCSAFEV